MKTDDGRKHIYRLIENSKKDVHLAGLLLDVDADFKIIFNSLIRQPAGSIIELLYPNQYKEIIESWND